MSFLELKNIGKIYVSDNNVSVGIRHVDLAFERGEFVAVTGSSGSGKSTLLNVISGMDTYEEGELLINGEPTSHYLQKDWEEYRKEYISFIFQDYNILESFTVLQNVELALMNIEDTAERREKALELIRRVGLEKHIHHKGSKLSGGQKQRTVIARALAKDSPVILADEPTGNLDSKTSEEIISLLHEVSRDKLVIVVTHNFEQVEKYATRHIRVFNGEIGADQVVAPHEETGKYTAKAEEEPKKRFSALKNGLILGMARFTATPKLSAFLCLLMTVTTLVLAIITSVSSDSKQLFEKNYIFRHIDGRVVIARNDGSAISDTELDSISEKFGCDSVRVDFMLDSSILLELNKKTDDADGYYYYSNDLDDYTYRCNFDYPAEKLDLDVGRYPENDGEIIISVPISAKNVLEKNGFAPFTVEKMCGGIDYVVTGVSYYYDNTKNGRIFFTEEGYKTATALSFYEKCTGEGHYYYSGSSIFGAYVGIPGIGSTALPLRLSRSAEKGKIYVSPSVLDVIGSDIGAMIYVPDMGIFGYSVTRAYDSYLEMLGIDEYVQGDKRVEKLFDSSDVIAKIPEGIEKEAVGGIYGGEMFAIISPETFCDFMYNDYFPGTYYQTSLFFDSDGDAHDAVEALRAMGYTAVASDETKNEDVMSAALDILTLGWLVVLWILGVVFISMLLGLCTSHAMDSVKGDVAIMRSMGIPTKVIKISAYVQTFISVVPAFVVTALFAFIVYRSPSLNSAFRYLHAFDYILVAAIVIGIAVRLSRKYVKKMFESSVKKTLKGGIAE